MYKCEVCAATFPSDWPLPIRCSHNTPGKQHAAPQATPLAAGPRAWQALHSYQQEGEWSPAKAQSFYLMWLNTIPSYGCACSSHWTAITKANPPVFDSEEAFFNWGVERHNEVNKKLGKPEFSIEQARLLHKPEYTGRGEQ